MFQRTFCDYLSFSAEPVHILDTGDVKLIGRQEYEEVSRESEPKTIICEPDSKLLKIQAGVNEEKRIVSTFQGIEQKDDKNQKSGAPSFMEKIVSVFKGVEKKDNNNQESGASSSPLPDPQESTSSSVKVVVALYDY